MATYSDVHEVLVCGDACTDCEWKIMDYGLRECVLILHNGDPEFCPGINQAVIAAGIATASLHDDLKEAERELEDDGFITLFPKGTGYGYE